MYLSQVHHTIVFIGRFINNEAVGTVLLAQDSCGIIFSFGAATKNRKRGPLDS